MHKGACLSLAAFVVIAGIALAQDSGIQEFIGNVALQDKTPGTPQIGHANIKGTFRAGQVNVSQPTASTIPIIGNNTATGSGGAVGGSFSSGQNSGIGVRGTATSQLGSSTGVYGEARSSSGIGVLGRSLKGTGVFGLTEAATGTGLWGRSTSPDAPGLIADNTTVNKDAAHFHGQLVMFDGSDIVHRGPNNTSNYRLASAPNGGFLNVGGGNAEVVAHGENDFASLDVRRNALNAVSLEVDQNGQGSIGADVKNFVQPDPDDLEMDIVYACVEGPEAAAYIRGTARLTSGVARVSLPRHFQSVAVAEGMTVQVTPRSRSSKGLAVESRSLESFEVGELLNGHGNYEFDWEVKAVRRGFTDYKVRRRWDARLSRDSNRQQAFAARKEKSERVYGIKSVGRP